MAERPILFSAPMVRALLDGRKTQTRRVIKPQPASEPDVWFINASGEFAARTAGNEWLTVRCPYGVPGDRLWVKETWRVGSWCDQLKPTDCAGEPVRHVADGEATDFPWLQGKTRVAIHMPRWASRITLEVKDVRVERLNDCSEGDAIAEGIDCIPDNFGNGPAYCDYLLPDVHDNAEWYSSPVRSYRSLWEHINGPGSWDANPWVWVVAFERVPA